MGLKSIQVTAVGVEPSIDHRGLRPIHQMKWLQNSRHTFNSFEICTFFFFICLDCRNHAERSGQNRSFEKRPIMTNEEQIHERYIWVAGFQVGIGWSWGSFQRSVFVNNSNKSTSRTLDAG